MMSGVYKISSLCKPDRIYIGSAVDIKYRWWNHLYTLKKSRHHSIKLQNHYNKYGPDDLTFEVLVECSKEELTKTEQKYLDSMSPYFNILKHAHSMLGFKHSDETKRKIGLKNKGKQPRLGMKHTEESKDAIRQKKLGRKQSASRCRKISKSLLGNKNAVGNKNKLGYKLSLEQKINVSIGHRRHHFKFGTIPTTLKIFADCADINSMKNMASDPKIHGWTTNPSILRRAGVIDYVAFGKEVAPIVFPNPISFEVIADDLLEMERQAKIISKWGDNVVVKIPVTTTSGESTMPLVASLTSQKVKINVTAVCSEQQIEDILLPQIPIENISIFAGRIADTGRDPMPFIGRARKLIGKMKTKIIWASPREILNIYHASISGAHIITLTPELLAKMSLFGKDLTEYSLETVKMFHDDAEKAGYVI